MNKYLMFTLSIILLVFFNSLQAQVDVEPEIGTDLNTPSNTKAKKKGVFMTFEDLKSRKFANYPDFEVKAFREFWGQSFQIFPGGKNKREKKAFAFSDGENIFINARNYKSGAYYVPIEILGRYYFFRDEVRRTGIGLGIGVGPVSVGSGGSQISGMVLDMKNGEFTRLKPKIMKRLLARYPELLQEYEKEKQRGSIGIMRNYILSLNQKIAE